MSTIVCIGNALIDAFLTIHEANDHCRINHETGELCMKAGEKIPLETAQFELGGNACNVAVGLSRLGLKTALVAEVGDDAFSHRIKKSLQQEGVDLSHFIVNPGPASFAIGINFKGDRTLFVEHVERKHEFDYEGLQPEWVYLSSMGDSWRHVYREVPAFVKRTGAKLVCNPGTRQIAAGKEALESALQASELLFLNKEEGMKLIGMSHQTEGGTEREFIHGLANELQKLGPKIVVITDGKRGSYCLDSQGKLHHLGIHHEEQAVELTGAGDAFATGFLAATVHGADIQTALQWGTINAASVVGKVGAQPGLLTKEQMEHKIGRL